MKMKLIILSLLVIKLMAIKSFNSENKLLGSTTTESDKGFYYSSSSEPVYYSYTPTTYTYTPPTYYYTANPYADYVGNVVYPYSQYPYTSTPYMYRSAAVEEPKPLSTAQEINLRNLEGNLAKLKKEAFGDENYSTNEIRNQKKVYDKKWLMAQLQVTSIVEMEDLILSIKNDSIKAKARISMSVQADEKKEAQKTQTESFLKIENKISSETVNNKEDKNIGNYQNNK